MIVHASTPNRRRQRASTERTQAGRRGAPLRRKSTLRRAKEQGAQRELNRRRKRCAPGVESKPVLAPLLEAVYRGGLLLGAPSLFFALEGPGWIASLAWIPVLLAVGITPLFAYARRRRDAVVLVLALSAALGAVALPPAGAFWVGGGGTLLAFSVGTPLIGFALDSFSDILE